ncbi:MAG TPA: DinB family protein [Ktedonobacteraceae bacterium]|nr:DinB family protein [Ktedonobacteraceae bacterium]
MTAHPFKPILLDLLHQAHLAQDAFLQELNPTEYTAMGEPDYWSAKDHVAHVTFWCQRLVLKLAAILHHETPPGAEDFERLNPVVFEEQRERPWSEVLAESEQVYTALITHVEQLTEEDLTAFNRFDWIPDGWPLYTAFMGNCYEHAEQHLVQYYLDRHDATRATYVYESWARRVVHTEAPEFLKGYVLYNLACFYATHAQLEKASTTLQQALTLAPQFKELSLTDPDLIPLRHQSEEGLVQ